MLELLSNLLTLWTSPELYSYTAPVFALAAIALCARLIIREY